MTAFAAGDEAKTIELVKMINAGESWLRHSRLAGELDWLLLHGASASELRDVRPTWSSHIQHLEDVHGLLVQGTPSGFFRIAGIRPDFQPPLGADSEGDEDESDDAQAVDAACSSEQALFPVRIAHSARSLTALHAVCESKNPMNKDAIIMFIRKASECSHWHNSTDYRSYDAAAAIAQAGISTVSEYQAFCTRELRHEHMVPNNVLYRMILSELQPTEEWLTQLFVRFSKRATITRKEDEKLRRIDMPPGFYEVGHPWYQNPLARYIEKKLAGALEQRQGPVWIR